MRAASPGNGARAPHRRAVNRPVSGVCGREIRRFLGDSTGRRSGSNDCKKHGSGVFKPRLLPRRRSACVCVPCAMPPRLAGCAGEALFAAHRPLGRFYMPGGFFNRNGSRRGGAGRGILPGLRGSPLRVLRRAVRSARFLFRVPYSRRDLLCPTAPAPAYAPAAGAVRPTGKFAGFGRFRKKTRKNNSTDCKKQSHRKKAGSRAFARAPRALFWP